MDKSQKHHVEPTKIDPKECVLFETKAIMAVEFRTVVVLGSGRTWIRGEHREFMG